jgi:hypothetical protein
MYIFLSSRSVGEELFTTLLASDGFGRPQKLPPAEAPDAGMALTTLPIVTRNSSITKIRMIEGLCSGAKVKVLIPIKK